MRAPHALATGAVALALVTSGCYGPFYLTRKVHQWNGEVSENKWVVEAVFLVCYVIPVYGIASLADGVIFNSIEFWTGENPMAPSASAPSTDGTVRRIVRGDDEAVLRRVGGELVIEQTQHGVAGPTLRVRRDAQGMVALGEDGAVLFSAQTLADGSVLIRDASGQPMATHSSAQVGELLASLPQ
jgi:hypothetical protein